ncbi:MAG: hypothetical protein JSS20_01455 [Proteobacteria bacterium]|nr:hypothetical protein [Pseudomonadota bacterium]
MSELFSSGAVADVIIAFMLVEAALIAVIKRPLPIRQLRMMAANLGAGASLVVALRLALTGHHWSLIALALVAAMIAHLLEVWLRFEV